MTSFLKPLLILLAVAVGGPAAAQTAIRLQGPFDPGQLSRYEARTLQAALAVEGSYDALLDGAWGQGSQAALEAWVRRTSSGGTPTWRDVRSLMRRWDAERRANGWTPVWHTEDRVFHLRPDALLRRSADGDDTRFVSEDGGLAIVTRRGGLRPTDLHEAFLQDAGRGSAPYRLREDRLLVTSAQMRGGRHVYVRSDLERGIWATHILLSDDANRGRLGLIASSFQRSRGDDVDPSDGRILTALLDGSGRPLPDTRQPRADAEPEARPDARPEDPLERILSDVLRRALDELASDDAPAAPEAQPPAQAPERDIRRRPASGFYVNTTDIVTSAELAARCDGVRISRGPRLTLLTVDELRGIAIYTGPGPVRSFLHLAQSRIPANAQIIALSRRPRGQGLQTNRGSVPDVSTRGYGGGTLSHDMAAPRRGELGAPLLNNQGLVGGIWLAGTDRPGTSPSVGALANGLREAGVPYLRGDVGRDVTGLPADAVVSLVCAR